MTSCTWPPSWLDGQLVGDKWQQFGDATFNPLNRAGFVELIIADISKQRLQLGISKCHMWKKERLNVIISQYYIAKCLLYFKILKNRWVSQFQKLSEWKFKRYAVIKQGNSIIKNKNIMNETDLFYLAHCSDIIIGFLSVNPLSWYLL